MIDARPDGPLGQRLRAAIMSFLRHGDSVVFVAGDPSGPGYELSNGLLMHVSH